MAGFGVPTASYSGPMKGTLEDRIENDLPMRKFTIQDRPQFDTTGILLITGVLK
jgi:hypothetical protein